MEQMSAYEIAKALNAEYHGEDVAIDHISTDSRDLSGNCLFVALEGERTDGHRYVAAALRGGARLAAVQKPMEGITPEEESRLLRVENTLGGQVKPDLATTKADKASHGFGVPGMREIAERYGGTLEAGERDGRFELVVCLPLK